MFWIHGPMLLSMNGSLRFFSFSFPFFIYRKHLTFHFNFLLCTFCISSVVLFYLAVRIYMVYFYSKYAKNGAWQIKKSNCNLNGIPHTTLIWIFEYLFIQFDFNFSFEMVGAKKRKFVFSIAIFMHLISRLVGKLTWTFSVSNRHFTSIEHGMKDEWGQTALECANQSIYVWMKIQEFLIDFQGILHFALNIEHEWNNEWMNECCSRCRVDFSNTTIFSSKQKKWNAKPRSANGKYWEIERKTCYFFSVTCDFA